jgi:hypothetical protein
MIQGIFIFLLSIAAAILYGILHDQVTARICLEYFTVYHPPIFGGLQDPTLLALGWGVIATWWVGAILGVPLALAARIGPLPKRSAVSMIRPIAVLLVCMACCAAAAGIGAYWYGSHRVLNVAPRLPASRQMPFLVVDAAAHLASYGSGFCGGCVLIVWTLFARWRELARSKDFNATRRPSAPAPSPAAES